MPTPMTAAPSIWFVPAPLLMMRPQSKTENDAAHAQTRDLRLPLHLGEMAAVGMQRILLRLGIFERRSRLAGRGDSAQVGHLQHFFEGNAVRRSWPPERIDTPTTFGC